MTDPVTLFILVTAGERADLTRAMAGATHDALGASAVVVVREVPGEPSDAEALDAERTEGADAVVELSWVDPHHQQASVKMHVARDRRWIERSVGFLRFDPDAERGRTLGFTIASILPQSPLAPTEATPASSGPTGASATATPTGLASSAAVAVAPPVPSSAALPAPSPPVPEPSAPARSGRRLNLSVDVLAVGAVGVGGNDPKNDANGSGGGAAAIQWFPIRNLALRLGGGLRAGSSDRAKANTLTVLGTGGLAFHPWRTSPIHPFGASLRADFLFSDESLTYFANGPKANEAQVQHRRHPGLELGVDASWRFASDVELVAGLGIEDVFTTTHVAIDHTTVATLSPVSAFAEAGLRLDF
jgi:hypothetical protein